MQRTILIAVALVCVTALAIALILRDDGAGTPDGDVPSLCVRPGGNLEHC